MKKFNRTKLLMLAIVIVFGISHPFLATASLIPAGSKIYIIPMENGLDQFISTEMLKKKVPVQIVLDESQADYILTGTAVKKEGSSKWYHYLTGTAGTSDSMQSSVTLINPKTKTLVWGTSVGDRSVFWGMLKKKGERKIAQRVVSKFKGQVFK